MTVHYPPVADYAFLSNGYSTALVSKRGSIDWCCLPRFDAGSVFARILDISRGGHFAATPRAVSDVTRRYVDESLVLETTLECADGILRLTDGFGIGAGSGSDRRRLGRHAEVVEGRVTVDVVVRPRFDYGQLRPWLRLHGDRCWSAVGGDDAFVLTTDVPLTFDLDEHALVGAVHLTAGDVVEFALEVQHPHVLDPQPAPPGAVADLLEDAVTWWREWHNSTRVQGPYGQMVRQSAAVLKGLTCAPTGAIIAAPTTSLPERLGAGRNWDYRYSWVRDASLALGALVRTGHDEVAQGYRDFLIRSSAGHADDLQLMYGCYGERELPERVVDLEGYRGSGPVRIGNGAQEQVQHDVLGHVLSVAEYWDDGSGIDDDEWDFLQGVADRAAQTWDRPGNGIWEMRGDPQHFTHSKVMIWAGLDRAVRLAEDRGQDGESRWGGARDAVRRTVEQEGVHADGWFTQTLSGEAVDAALLRLPTLGFVDVSDERFVATVRRIEAQLVGKDGFVLRYDPAAVDDGTDEHADFPFVLCTLWYVEVLAALGDVDRATALFERVLAAANDVGLLSEEYDPDTGELMGNYPQAFSHLALVDAAWALTDPSSSARQRNRREDR